MHKEIRQQERRLAKTLVKAAASHAKDTDIFRKEVEVQMQFQEQQRRKMELLERKAELLRQMDEQEARFAQEKLAEEEQKQAAMLRKVEQANNERVRAKTAAEKLISTKKRQAELEEMAARERETVRLAELDRAKRMVELQKTRKPTETFAAETNPRLKRGPKPEDFAHTNLRVDGFKVENEEVCELEEKEEDFRTPVVPKKVFSPEMIAKTTARAKEVFKQAVKTKAEDKRAAEERTERIAQNLEGLREAAKGNRNLLVFKEDQLAEMFAEFMAEEPAKLVKVDVESRERAQFYWTDFAARKQFMEEFGEHTDQPNDNKSVSFNYSVSDHGHRGQDSDLSSFEEKEEEAEEDEPPKNSFRKKAKESDEPVDINKFISEQEEFIRNLSRKNECIREEIQSYEYSDEPAEVNDETPEEKQVPSSAEKSLENKKTKKLPPPKPTTVAKQAVQSRKETAELPKERRKSPRKNRVKDAEDIYSEETEPAAPVAASKKRGVAEQSSGMPSLFMEYEEDQEGESVNLSAEVKKVASSSGGKGGSRRSGKLTEIAEIAEEEDSQGSHIYIKNEGHKNSSRKQGPYDPEATEPPSKPKQASVAPSTLPPTSKDSAYLKSLLQGYELSESESDKDGHDTPTFQKTNPEAKAVIKFLEPAKQQKAGVSGGEEVQGKGEGKPEGGKKDVQDKDEMKRLRAKRMAYKPPKPEAKPAKKPQEQEKAPGK